MTLGKHMAKVNEKLARNLVFLAVCELYGDGIGDSFAATCPLSIVNSKISCFVGVDTTDKSASYPWAWPISISMSSRN